MTTATAYQSQTGVEALAGTGKAYLFQGFAEGFNNKGLLPWSSMLADEFAWLGHGYAPNYANIDARMTTGAGGFNESGDQPLPVLMSARVTLLTAVAGLRRYEPPTGRSRIGEAYALIAYTELLLAEDYCAGVSLGEVPAGGGVQYGTPLTTDSLLRVAEAHLDSALAYASGNDTVRSFASVGLARTRLDRGEYASAAAAVAGVPTSFVYNAELEPGGYASVGGAVNTFNMYDQQAAEFGCGYMNVADRKGQNGLNYLSAGDPRVVIDSTLVETCDHVFYGLTDSVWYYPMKFGNPSVYVPLATGVEARLIEAEAALKAGQVGQWAVALNALRQNAPTTYLVLGSAMDTLPSDSTTTTSPDTQLDVMFRERAFWLFGTGTRLGDMRRLVRQYGRDQSKVFAVGHYPNGANPLLPSPIPNYGTDVSLTLPTAAGGLMDPNPAYKGCLTSTKVA